MKSAKPILYTALTMALLMSTSSAWAAKTAPSVKHKGTKISMKACTKTPVTKEAKAK